VSAHTPGKWFTELDSRGWVVYAPDPSPHPSPHASNSDLIVVADFLTDGNARLIAAAPELLEAAQQAFSDLDSLMDFVGESNAIRMVGAREAYGRSRKTIDALHAAIKKATEA